LCGPVVCGCRSAVVPFVSIVHHNEGVPRARVVRKGDEAHRAGSAVGGAMLPPVTATGLSEVCVAGWCLQDEPMQQARVAQHRWLAVG
jgi:hypothetical protein